MMGFFDNVITQKDSEYIPVWQWVHDLAITHDSYVGSVISVLQENHKDLTVYQRNDNAIYTPKSKTGHLADTRTVFESYLGTLKSYIDQSGELDVDSLENETANNPTYTNYLKKSELPTFGEQSPSPSMAGVNDSNSPMNAGEIIAGLQTRILDLQRQLNATTANDGNQQQIADLQAENAKLKARIAELESELNQANITPAIKHTNTALQALHDVLVTHWQDYDPTNETTKPKQEYIERWIMENYPELNQSKARWIDKIIRHGTHD